MPEYEEEWQRGEDSRDISETDHPAADQVAAPYRSHLARLRDTLHTSQRATAFTMSVMTNSVAPTAISADKWRSLVASLNSFAINDAIVYPGANNDADISGRFPITMVTAIVSPRARPRPSIIPPMMPDQIGRAHV